jgi:TRAP-type C4-dicarboxylate transport system permease small subunit
VRVVGPDRNKHLRNIAIIVALALAVWLLPGGNAASVTISNLLGIVFIGGILFFGYRLYMEHRETIFGLEERQRGILYASVALGAITLVATRRMWDEGGLGPVLWLAFMGAAIWGLFSVWRAYREY